MSQAYEHYPPLSPRERRKIVIDCIAARYGYSEFAPDPETAIKAANLAIETAEEAIADLRTDFETERKRKIAERETPPANLAQAAAAAADEAIDRLRNDLESYRYDPPAK